MIRTYSYPLRPTRKQAQTLTLWLILCQRLYNAALEQRRHAYSSRKLMLSRYDQYKELTQLRAEDPTYAAVSLEVLRSSLHRLDLAFKAFFRRCQAGKCSGFPRFRSVDRYDSFSFPQPKITEGRLKIPNLGCIKTKLYRHIPDDAVLREARVVRTCRGWKACLVLDVGSAPAKVPIVTHVGIDLGLTKFAVLSTGEPIKNPRFLKRALLCLARRQQSLADKQRGSKSRQAAKRLVGRAHEHIQNQRLDHARKLARDLCGRFDLISIEKLDITDIIGRSARARSRTHRPEQSPKLTRRIGPNAKSFYDAAWRVFLRCLSSKAEEAGKIVIAVDPHGTSQRCSRCGEMTKKTLADRVHRCKHCGLVLDRDHNAAINIDALGWSAVSVATQVAA